MNEQTTREWEILSGKANLARSRLTETLDRLDRRRHQLFDTPWLEIAAIAGGALLVLGGLGLAIHAARRPARLGHERLRALQRLWEHPERAFQKDTPSVWGDVGRKVLLHLAPLVVTQVAKHAAGALEAEPAAHAAP